MPGYKISQLNPSTSANPRHLIPVADSGTSTTKLELSSLWEACLDGTLNDNNTAIFKQNVTIQDNTILGTNTLNTTTINGSLILTAPNGNKYNISVNNFGVLSAVAI